MHIAVQANQNSGVKEYIVQISKTLGQQLSLQIFNLDGCLLYARKEAITCSPEINKQVCLSDIDLDKGLYLLVVSDGIHYRYGSFVVPE